MAQNNFVAQDLERFTRSDYSALLALLNGLSFEFVIQRYYCADDLEALQLTESHIRDKLARLKAQLIQRAIESNPYVAQSLQNAASTHRWSRSVVTYLLSCAEPSHAIPKPHDYLSQWLLPRIALRLKSEGASTVAELVTLINRRGYTWYRRIPYLGEGKAKALIKWLQAHQASVGLLAPQSLSAPALSNDLMVLSPEAPSPAFAPLERLRLSPSISGVGAENRYAGRALISAKDDLEAIDAYLTNFDDSPKTQRSYAKEIERFLAWSVTVQAKPMSGLLVEDCQAYLKFIAHPDPAWTGPRAPRSSPLWRPFAGVLSAKSQKYAVNVLRALFVYLVDARYLAGNPWKMIKDPIVVEETEALQISKALESRLWEKLSYPNGILDLLCQTDNEILHQRYPMRGWAKKLNLAAQYRLLRAAVLIMGTAGLRRDELVKATRNRLRVTVEDAEIWELSVVGKGSKARRTYLAPRVVAALRDHWLDRGETPSDFDLGLGVIPLIAPVDRQHTPNQRGVEPSLTRPFSVRAINHLVQKTFQRLSQDTTLDLSEAERLYLTKMAPHDFRHTFGTENVRHGMPVDVLQKLLGHASLETTTIYLTLEKQRAISETKKVLVKQKSAAA